jgi:hypothetical protein
VLRARMWNEHRAGSVVCSKLVLVEAVYMGDCTKLS